MAYIGRDIRTGAFRQLDDISSGFDGSDTTHTMQVNSTNVSVGDVNQILLSLGGVIQKPGTDFTVSGSTLTFTTAPAANTSFFAILLGSDNGGTVTPTDESVTDDKLANTISTINNTGGNLTVDVSGTIVLDADTQNASGGILLKDGGIHYGSIYRDGSDLKLKATVQDEDIAFVGDDGGTEIEAMRIDMSATGNVGIGTASPVSDAKLTISSADTESAIFLERSGSGKFDSAIHNTGGSLIFKGGSNQTTVASLTEFMRIDSVGHVTKPLQSACLVAKTSTQSDVANTDTITFDTERFDVNADFASNTFTAPVTGKYLITFCVSVTAMDYDATYNRVKLVTSNRNYSFGIVGEQNFTANPNYVSFEGALLVDMDASDTAKLEWSQAGGLSIADIFDSTNLSIVLIC